MTTAPRSARSTPLDVSGLPQPTNVIEAVDRALRLVEELVRVRHVRVIDVAEMLDISMSAAHRLLSTLEVRGFATHAQTGRGYVPGPQLVDLADRSMAVFDLRERACVALDLLSADLEETLHFAVLQGSGVRFIEAVEGRIATPSRVRRGLLLPAHATSAGKALLAALSESVVRDMHPRGIFPLTDQGLCTVDELVAELDRVRHRGYAINRGESEAGVTGIAVRARAPHGRAVGAIVVTAPSERMTANRIPGVAARLRRAAQAMEVTAR